jgi:CO/xanthine dehydrogenase FAD-binding subunit
MMPNVKSYHRPRDVEEALKLLVQHGETAAILAGGTGLVPELDDEAADLIDLQFLGLEQIEFSEQRVTVGAMVPLRSIVENESLPAVIRRAARYEGPNTLRNAATVGGTIVGGDCESEFLAALLAFEATVTVQTPGDSCGLALEEFMVSDFPDGIITEVSFALGGPAAHERVARTPTDKAIVAVIGRRNAVGDIRLAFCGLTNRPVLLTLSELREVVPPADFRGSSQYRRAVAMVLAERVRQALA